MTLFSKLSSKKPFFYFLVTILFLFVNSCSKTSPPPEDQVISQIDEKAINIGYIHGAAIRLKNSVALAAKHINDAGGILGKKINIIYNLAEDTETAINKSIALMDNYAIQALISTTSSRTIAITSESIKRNVIVISDTGTSPLLTTIEDNDLLFRTPPSDIHQGKVMADLAISKGANKAIFIHNEGDIYGSSLANEFKNKFDISEINQTDVITIPDNLLVGFDAYMPQIFESNPDVIIVALVRTAINANFINETQNFNFNGFFLFPDVATNTTLIDNLANPQTIKQAYGVTPSFGLQTSQQFKFFSESYVSYFNEPIQNYNSNAYDAVIILALAIEHAGLKYNSDNPTGEMIKESMREIMNTPGTAVGPSNISEAINLIKQNIDIDYHGAYSDNEFDNNGDISGTLVYDTFEFDNQKVRFNLIEQIIIDVPTGH